MALTWKPWLLNLLEQSPNCCAQISNAEFTVISTGIEIRHCTSKLFWQNYCPMPILYRALNHWVLVKEMDRTLRYPGRGMIVARNWGCSCGRKAPGSTYVQQPAPFFSRNYVQSPSIIMWGDQSADFKVSNRGRLCLNTTFQVSCRYVSW